VTAIIEIILCGILVILIGFAAHLIVIQRDRQQTALLIGIICFLICFVLLGCADTPDVYGDTWDQIDSHPADSSGFSID